ncbi:Alpha/beta-Hydrolases superfamily protein isoform 3 [Theobroma cacao]|uniref:Alpha/beta-Hydrolases superfamily protein isoform 3 n=1 Tax=Theobroma cacao TaxID=3641 RepID=A0A061DM13_THECC|nr:Alpha/beta-Hydrolases superfamily protein isoform 3 [Theobroma cacao]
MAIQGKPPSLFCHQFQCSLYSPTASKSLLFGGSFQSRAQHLCRKPLRLSCSRSNANEPQDDYLIDAPVSAGDGFSFSGGKYSDEANPSDEWFKRGKYVKAHPVGGTGEKAKDPIFGLTMGAGSQASGDVFRWFCVESGNADNHTVILIHGFPSQAYSYRKVLPVLSKNYRAIAFDWLGFGFSDKPQPRYGFDYSLGEYVSALESFVNEVAPNKVSLVVQGYFSPVVVKYASKHQEKLNDLILLNPPLTAKHANLPSTLSIFSNFLLGEIFSQAYVEEMKVILMDKSWKVQTTVCWGQRDRWLSYDQVEDLCESSNHKLIELPMAGHHVQEDCGEEIGGIISGVISRRILR